MNAAVNLLNTYDRKLVHLFSSIEQLLEIDGIEFQESFKIKTTFKLTKRIAAYCEENRPKITSKDDVGKSL